MRTGRAESVCAYRSNRPWTISHCSGKGDGMDSLQIARPRGWQSNPGVSPRGVFSLGADGISFTKVFSHSVIFVMGRRSFPYGVLLCDRRQEGWGDSVTVTRQAPPILYFVFCILRLIGTSLVPKYFVLRAWAHGERRRIVKRTGFFRFPRSFDVTFGFLLRIKSNSVVYQFQVSQSLIY
jgi:hypothetical protein